MKSIRGTASLCLFSFDHTALLSRKFIKHIAGVIGLYISCAAAVHAMPMYEYAGGEIVGVSGLTIGTDIWDLTLYGSSYDTVYNSASGPVLFDDSFAHAATDALTSFIGSEPLPAPDDFRGCTYHDNCYIVTVSLYDLLHQNVSGFATGVNTQIAYTTSIYISSHLDYSNVLYASWTLAGVPEPNIVLLMASGLIVLGVVRRKGSA